MNFQTNPTSRQSQSKGEAYTGTLIRSLLSLVERCEMRVQPVYPSTGPLTIDEVLDLSRAS
jgi:hypothetical protein